MAGNAFWTLVKHDLKVRGGRRGRIPGKWRVAYAAAILVVLLALATWKGHLIQMDFTDVWYFTFGLPFMVFGMSIGRVTSEWKNATVGWWLTIPMSRWRLMLSKCVSSILFAVLIFACVYGAIAILGLYTMYLNGSFSTPYVRSFLLAGLRWNALLLCACPFIAAFGLLFGVILQSVVRQAMPLIWIAFGGMWWLVSAHLGFIHIDGSTPPGLVHVSTVRVLSILGSWILACLMVGLASVLLDRYAAV
ncbi:hypothetical protein JI721_02210 [Alicyclobacillus cycloheptanicus]|uniref:ABC-2 type transport system permease protein n=1 Tax=Alicyclobacillus cycloheptanicus TaxID=1457 RepID=A0ABT9XF89_9BACL|nr:hypothetical protein [Alicyclobacillus cycloheptanicus]MDQ0188965.1 ABC-2 type transport system permease protein [Alicyclobacillus cycloheptanicus]WDM01688.1 hypothetical protein JI721_02210 [Alicyclobacillus cycloheptanicus]